MALVSGLLLGLAALTRQTGILLGAAIVYQAVGQWRRGGIRMVVPEFIAAATGAAMYLSWGAYTAIQIAKHPALTGNYANHGLSLFTDFSITELTLLVFDLFWKWDDVLGRLGISPKATIGLLIIPAAILVIGLITLTRRSQIHASDVYALATLACCWVTIGRSHATCYRSRPSSLPGSSPAYAIWAIASLGELAETGGKLKLSTLSRRSGSPSFSPSMLTYFQSQWQWRLPRHLATR